MKEESVLRIDNRDFILFFGRAVQEKEYVGHYAHPRYLRDPFHFARLAIRR